jgi:nucleoid-associated protein YgaU
VTLSLENKEDYMTQSTPVPGQDYIVQPGDDLSKIAQEAYGDGSQASWQKIYDANRDKIGPDPNNLVAGTVIHIPPL